MVHLLQGKQPAPPLAGKSIAALLISAISVAVAAQTRPDSERDTAPIVVLRGSPQQQSADAPQPTAAQAHTSRTGTARQENGVTVIRPAPDSFLRETRRLAANEEARAASVARDDAQATNRQLRETLEALEAAARAAEHEARTRAERYYPVYVPRQLEPKDRPPAHPTQAP
jgi:hypothetical protein